ncbi:hypothetical protein FC756_09515 [Lysinibacillus mangiferihumi]|uniref:Uncharacterized protein n=1 Tax=Lysinibacillus mangiferihumi TaxID=1130819 RepID=A0A4V5TLU6_9BACI|nr:hypothetical protein [Lysinibacillus mangiferihumi]TKI69193.1 hypothetical protein FC756_09515 [Lysinibacillus mangiferihumi]
MALCQYPLKALRQAYDLSGSILFINGVASLLTLTTKPLALTKGLKIIKTITKLRVPIEQFSLMIVIAICFKQIY